MLTRSLVLSEHWLQVRKVKLFPELTLGGVNADRFATIGLR